MGAGESIPRRDDCLDLGSCTKREAYRALHAENMASPRAEADQQERCKSARNKKHYLRARRTRVPKRTTASAGRAVRHSPRLNQERQTGAARVSRGLSEGESDCRKNNASQANLEKMHADFALNLRKICRYSPLESAVAPPSIPG